MSMPTKTCTLLFLLRGDEILLAMKKRGFGAGRYNGVGGKIDPGETLEQALIRECQEEIGVTPLEFEKVAEHDFVANTNAPWRMYVHAFVSRKWSGEPIETEEMKPRWFDVSAIPYKEMWQDDEFWLPQVLSGGKLKGKFTFDDKDNMLTHDMAVVKDFK